MKFLWAFAYLLFVRLFHQCTKAVLSALLLIEIFSISQLLRDTFLAFHAPKVIEFIARMKYSWTYLLFVRLFHQSTKAELSAEITI